MPNPPSILTAKEAQKLDRISIEDFCIPGTTLMENAGRLCADQIHSTLESSSKGIIFSGTGNNGGDGFVIARLLSNLGHKIEVIIVGDIDKIGGDAKWALTELKNVGGKIDSLEEISGKAYDFAVDCLLGTGFKPPLSSKFLHAIAAFNTLECKKFAIDLPSGMIADATSNSDQCVVADTTLTIGASKPCLEIYPSKENAGKVITLDIGFPTEAFQHLDTPVELNDTSSLDWSHFKRTSYSHKGTYGHTLIVGGVPGMLGAPLLAAKAALKIGTGLVSLWIPKVHPLHRGFLPPEIMVNEISDDVDTCFDIEHIAKIKKYISVRNISSIAIGMGIGRDENTFKFLEGVLSELDLPTVIDADALFFYPRLKHLLPRKKTVITPHPGEYNRIFSQVDFEKDIDALTQLRKTAQDEKIHLIYKSATSVLCSPEGKAFINPYGNPGMASAGMGDTLAGICAGIMGQRIDFQMAIRLGIAIHSLSADLFAKENGQVSLTASDVINGIPRVVEEYS